METPLASLHKYSHVRGLSSFQFWKQNCARWGLKQHTCISYGLAGGSLRDKVMELGWWVRPLPAASSRSSPGLATPPLRAQGAEGSGVSSSSENTSLIVGRASKSHHTGGRSLSVSFVGTWTWSR